MNMSKNATREYIQRMRVRYEQMKNKKAKGRVLDDYCATTGRSRKHAIKVLGSREELLVRSGRKREYGERVARGLERLWIEAGQPCSKLMKPMMECYVSSYERRHGSFAPQIREQMLKVSASSMDRLLRSSRVRWPRRRCSPAGVAAVKKEVPIRAGEWHVAEPGWVEADTVAHCGGNMAGSFVWSLTLTDILTQWTEIRAMWNRGASGTIARIQQVEKALPFAIRGFDSDNGPEFMNWNLYTYWNSPKRPVSFTRSRSYMKNDNAHVEQKNGTHVRGLLGHDRIDDPECVEALNQALVQWSLWKNLYSPVRKLVSKRRIGHRYSKRYDEPQTPAQRVLQCAWIDEAQKERIRNLLSTTDCFTLKQQVNQQLKDVFAAIRQRQEDPRPHPPFSGRPTSALRAAPAGTVFRPKKGASQEQKLQQRMVS